MVIDAHGVLILSASKSDNVSAHHGYTGWTLLLNRSQNSKVITKQYPLSEFRPPYIPDQDRQELPNSVVLDFKDGSTLQCACEHLQGQAGVLKGMYRPVINTPHARADTDTLQLSGTHSLHTNRSYDFTIYPLLFSSQGMYYTNIASSIFGSKQTCERITVLIFFGVDRIWKWGSHVVGMVFRIRYCKMQERGEVVDNY